MYCQHFAFTGYPFQPLEHADRLFESRAARETATRLRHLLELRGIGLLTGESGCGKTSAVRQVCERLHPSRHRVFYVPLTTGSVLDLYQTVGWAFGLEVRRTRASARRAIRAEISRRLLEARQLAVLVIDDAHHLLHAVLEELRLLTSFSMDSQQRLCLLLVGLPELRHRLALAVHESLRQRIVVRHHHSAIGRDELAAYLCHRLRLAGCELELFQQPACEAIFQATGGLPRKIDRIAHFALTAAALASERAVSAEHVEAALGEVRR